MSTPQVFLVYARSHNRSVYKACRAPIQFYQHAITSKWMPFDDGVEILRSFSEAHVTHEIRGVPHFSTCPAADAFRKKRAPSTREPEQGSLL